MAEESLVQSRRNFVFDAHVNTSAAATGDDARWLSEGVPLRDVSQILVSFFANERGISNANTASIGQLPLKVGEMRSVEDQRGDDC